MNTDDLIDALATDLQPVRRAWRPTVATLVWAAVTAGLVAAVLVLSHVRPDWRLWIWRPDTAIEVGLAVLTGVTAAFAVFHLAIPGRGVLWAVAPAVIGLGWLSVVGIGCWDDIVSLRFFGLEKATSPSCLAYIAGFGSPVLLATLLMARHALLLRPVLVSLLAALAAAGCADAGVVIGDHPHAAATTLVFCGGASLLLTALAKVLGRRWMRRTVAWRGVRGEAGTR